MPAASSNSVLILGLLAHVYESLRPVHLLFHFAIHLLPLPLGIWAGQAWPGWHPRGHILLGALAGLAEALTILLMVSVARSVGTPIRLLPEDALGLLATVFLFTAGALFADLSERWRSRPKDAGRGASDRTLVLIQSLGPAALTLVGTIITAAVTLLK